MRLVIGLILFVLVAGGVLFVMTGSVERDANELRVAYVEIDTLDPQRMRASEDIRIAFAVFEGLCTFDPYEFTVEPGVAERWTVSDDGLTYTFHLREDAAWSNGEPVTTRDFVESWRQAMMIDLSPPYYMYLMFIDGAEDYRQWTQDSLERVRAIEDPQARQTAATERIKDAWEKFNQLVAVDAPDERTLTLRLARPVPYFLECIACWP